MPRVRPAPEQVDSEEASLAPHHVGEDSDENFQDDYHPNPRSHELCTDNCEPCQYGAGSR